MSLQDIQARVEIVNFLNAVQNTPKYYIDVYNQNNITKRSLGKDRHSDQHIPDTEIVAEIHDLRDHLGDLFALSKVALDSLEFINIQGEAE